jgi:hypothetical protein
MEYTREDLIKICENAVVHHKKWGDRDSYIAQRNIQSIYKGLTAGLDFRIVTKEIDASYHSNDSTLIIEFMKPIEYNQLEEKGKHLRISSREDYFKDCDPDYETEMFSGDGIDFHSEFTQTFMPTQARLDACGKGNDWY